MFRFSRYRTQLYVAYIRIKERVLVQKLNIRKKGQFYKFRAEVMMDIEELLRLLPVGELITINVKVLSDGLPDREAIIELKTLSLSQIRGLMSKVKDGHVMLETVALKQNYTGKRTSEG